MPPSFHAERCDVCVALTFPPARAYAAAPAATTSATTAPRASFVFMISLLSIDLPPPDDLRLVPTLVPDPGQAPSRGSHAGVTFTPPMTWTAPTCGESACGETV